MNRLILGALFFFFGLLSVSAQPVLGPSIGIGQLPGNNSEVCDIPLFLESFVNAGLDEGELIPDFNLYDIDGNEMVMSELLGQGKPVLMISASYSCWVFRNKIAKINELIQYYGSEVEVIIIYTLEAHPFEDISPYYGYENVGGSNLANDILYHQPVTYGQRRLVVNDMLNDFTIDAPVYLDGPCNNWWETFGPAPNIGYLIDTDGIILAKHPWFDKHPWDIDCDLEQYLGINTGCGNVGQNGSFSFEEVSSQNVQGPAGSTLYATGMIENNSEEAVEIEITKLEVEMPGSWENSICTDVCYPPSTQTALVLVEAGETLHYTQYFYTDDLPASGYVRIGFRNTSNDENAYSIVFSAETYTSVSTADQLSEQGIRVYPNPVAAGQEIVIDRELPEGEALTWFLYDAKGQQVQAQRLNGQQTYIPSDNLSSGLYYYQIQSETGLTSNGKIFIQ